MRISHGERERSGRPQYATSLIAEAESTSCLPNPTGRCDTCRATVRHQLFVWALRIVKYIQPLGVAGFRPFSALSPEMPGFLGGQFLERRLLFLSSQIVPTLPFFMRTYFELLPRPAMLRFFSPAPHCPSGQCWHLLRRFVRSTEHCVVLRMQFAAEYAVFPT